MKTILKFPVYVEILTDNVDRKIVSDAATQILYPALIQYVGSAAIRTRILGDIKEATKLSNLDIKFLTEMDLFRNQK